MLLKRTLEKHRQTFGQYGKKLKSQLTMSDRFGDLHDERNVLSLMLGSKAEAKKQTIDIDLQNLDLSPTK